MRRTVIFAATAMLLLGATSAARPGPRLGGEQLPNLVPLAPSAIDIRKSDNGNQWALRFSVSIANEAEYAFELLARAEGYAGDSNAQAEQCVAWAGPRVCSERRSIGTLTYHSPHGHYHFEDFALYELRLLKKNGRPDMTPAGLVRTSDKVSFCLQDVSRRDESDPLYTTPWPPYYGCYAGQGVQGISPGWMDIYGWGTRGQQILLEGIDDGTYVLVLHTDPGNRVFESNDADNISSAVVTLLDNGKKVEVVCSSPPGTLACR